MEAERLRGRNINMSSVGQATQRIWATITTTASWTHTRPHTRPISTETEITLLSRTKIQTPCSFRLLQSDWFTDVSYMRVEREAMEVGEEGRRDREGTEFHLSVEPHWLGCWWCQRPKQSVCRVRQCNMFWGWQSEVHQILQLYSPGGHMHSRKGQHCIASLKPSFHTSLLTQSTSCQFKPVVWRINLKAEEEKISKILF